MIPSVLLIGGLAASASAKDLVLGLSATGPNTQFYDMPINAVDGGFWVNRYANQYCPPAAGTQCANGTGTVIYTTTGKNSQISLGSIVPGGQDVYISPTGEFGYQKSHSDLLPKDAIVNPKGFKYVKPKGKYNEVGRLEFPGKTFVLCGPEDPASPKYQLKFDVGNAECTPIEIGARLAASRKTQVWQYN